MIRIEHEIAVDRAPADVFAYVTDPAKLTEWQATAHGARMESETMGTGTRMVEERTFLGRRMETQMEVTAYEPNSRFDLQALSGPIRFRAEHRLEPTNGGTRIHFVLEGEPGGFFRFAEPIVERQARRQVESDFETLKQLLESPGG